MAEKKSWRDYSKQKSANSTEGSEKTGSWRDYSSSLSANGGSSTGSWRDYSTNNSASIAGGNVVNRVNNWLSNYNSLISDYQKRHEGRKYTYEDSYVSDSADWLDTVNKRKSESDAEYEDILLYIAQNKDYLDQDWLKEIQGTLTKVRDAQGQIVESSTKDNEWWNSFGTEELVSQYGSAEDAYKHYQQVDEMGKADLNALSKEIEDLGNLYDQSYTIGLWYDEYKRGLAPYDAQKLEVYNRFMKEYGGDEKALKSAYDQKEEYLKSATEIQENNRQRAEYDREKAVWDRYTQESDFEEFSNAGANIKNPTMTEAESDGRFLWWEWDGADVGNIVTYSRENADALAMAQGNNANTQGNHVYRNMEEDEVKIYNYLLAKYGKEKGDEYLSFLMDELLAREGGEQAKRLKGIDIPVIEELAIGAFGTLAGVDQWASGTKQFFTNEKLPATSTQYANSALANSMNGLGKYAYQATNVIGNMLPSIAMSKGLGALGAGVKAAKLAGAATMSIGAAGNAYAEGLEEYGMEPWQARIYGILVGAAEGGLEYAMGGIPALRGTEDFVSAKINMIDKFLPRVSAKIGWDIVQEIGEEELQNYLEPLFRSFFTGEYDAPTFEELLETAIVTAISTPVMGGLDTVLDDVHGGKKALKEYGNKTDALIQEGLGNDVTSDSYKLATKYQQQVQGKDGKQGKALTGQQIRNLLAANQEQITPNDLKKIQKAAEARLTELGQTEDVQKLAELATKYVTGQKMSKDEKAFLANNKNGNRVAQEALPENVLSGDYTSEWAEDIGTKKVNATAYNIKSIIDQIAKMDSPASYKSLEERVGEEEKLAVSKSGKATIRSTGEAIDLSKVEVADFITDKKTGKITDMTLKADGKEVKASDIDYADDNQSYLFSAVKNIENITPGDATAFIRDYDPSSGQTVGEYLNGIDEAFTYGYHKYSEADMGAGLFTPKLTSEQAKGAYLLGQTSRSKTDANKSIAIKRMRTAVEAETAKATAEGKAAPKSKKLTITYNEGGKIKAFDDAGIKLAPKQEAAVTVAKFLHKLGLGTNFEFFASKESKNIMVTDKKTGVVKPARVFINDAGVEESAPAGVYRKTDGTIRIDLNAYNGRGLALYSLAHELTHFIQQWSDEKYKVLADFLVKTYEKTDMTMHQRVLEEQARLEDIRGEEISYNEAYDEVVAKAMMKMFDDGKLVERLTELKAKDKKLAQKLWEGFKKFLDKFFGVYNSDDRLYKDSDDLVKMKDAFEQLQNLFAEALVEASENYQTYLTASEMEVLNEAGFGFDENTRSMYSLDFSTAYKDEIQVGKKAFNAEAIAQLAAKVTGRSIEDARKWVNSEMTIANIVMRNPEYLDFEADNRYEAIKKNSDYPQGTVDLSNLCPKREEFTTMFDMLQKKYPNKLFTAQDVADMRKILSDNGITVACGACFVEDRRQLIGEIADTFIGMWKEAVESGKPLQKTNAAGNKVELLVTKALAKQYGLTAGTKIMAKDTYIPNQYDLTTYEGFKLLEKNHPTIAMAFNRYNNSRGQQSARLIEGRAEYKRQILGWSDAKVRSVNNNGGLRIFSFSDFEVVHLLDLVQVIIDCAAKGVKIQGYTKIPAFAKLVRNTGVKLNRSHIPMGDYGYHMENGKVVLDCDTTEGINTNDKNFMDESDNPDVGDVIIGINPTQIGAAMLDPFFDYIIPFHSNKAKEILRKLGTGEWVNYKESQHDKDISTGKASKHNVNIYTEVINKYHPTNKVEFVEAFLKECKRQGKIPRYAEFLNVDANGDYAYREGYHKLLVDFKMFDKDGNILPQGNITPNLDENFMKELLNAEIDKKQNYEFPQEVYDAIDKKFGEQYSSQETDAEGYDTRNLEWAIESGVISESDQARFWEAIAEIQKLNYNSFARTKNGAYIIETTNTMMFTDGDYKAPTLSKVIVFPYGEYVDTSKERVMIRNEARTTGRTNQSTEFIERLSGPGFVTEYHAPHYRADGREIARGEGTHSSRTASKSGGRGVRHGGTDGLQSGHEVNHDFLSDDKLKGNYTVSEISEMFDAWNSDPELDDLSKKVFAKLQEIQDNLSRPASYPGLGTWPYKISFKSEAYMQKEFFDAPHGVFAPRSNDSNYGITYNLDYFKSVSDQEKAHVLLHEAIHACTYGAIKSAENRIPNYSPNKYTLDITPDDSWGELQKAGLELIQVFNQVGIANKGNEYGQKSVHEMVAEMSNPEFRDMLKKQSLWGTIVDAIKRIFGIQRRTAYDSVSNALEKILELDMQKKTGEVYSSQETDADNAPTFYSHMAKVVNGMKQEKFGASSVISMLIDKKRGVKAEEIRWSGIQAFLDGKKSVTKADLLDFINSSMLHIEEETRSSIDNVTKEFVQAWRNFIDPDLDESEILDGLNYVDTSLQAHLEGLVEDGDLDQYYADYILDLAKRANKHTGEPTKWDEYKLDGGSNYRELIFKMPGTTYTNMAMQGHWGVEAQGVLAHARMQDFDTADGKMMLFIEEIQSDWHNQGHKEGYRKEGEKTERMLRAESKKAYEEFYAAVEKMLEDNADWEDDNAIYYAHPVVVAEMFDGNESHFEALKFTDEQKETIRAMVAEESARQEALKTAPKQDMAPDAPFKENYHEFVLKRLLRMAAEEGYDSIGWTTSDLQMDRWNPDRRTNESMGVKDAKNPDAIAFELAYQNLYDRNMRKFLEKYGKQWGAEVGKTALDNGTEVWSMDITDAMKKSVLTEGQAMYSSQETDLDSHGKKLSKEQAEFFAYSVVRSKDGKLLVVYHGGTVENQFDTSRGGNGATQYGPGAYFTDSEYYAKEYTYYRGGEVKPYYLNIERLFDDTDMGATAQMPEWKKLEQILRDNGIEEKFIKRFADGGFAYMSRYLALKSGAKTSDSWAGSDRLNAMLREAGYQGIKGVFNDMHQYVVFDPEQAKFTSNKQPTTNPDMRFSTQETDNISNRDLLANAFEGLSQNSDEYKMIQEYKGHIKLLNEYEEKLDKLNAEIRKITFDTEGKRDSKKLKELQDEAKKVAANINRHDKKLISMEASGPLRKVIEFERKKAAQKTRDHVKEIQKNKKTRAEQTELRHKIRKAVRDLDKLLNRGNKKMNVKEDMKGFVSKALELADYIFTDHISNEELIRRGITVRMTPIEAALVKETEDIISQLYDNADNLTDEEFTELDAKRKSNLDKLRDLLTAQRNESLNIPVYNLFNDLVTEYASLKNSKQDSVKAAYNEELENSLRAFMSDDDRVKILKNMRVADMTTEELNWLYRAYTMVLTNVRNANKFHVNGMNATIEQVVGQISVDFGSRKIPEKKLAIAMQKLVNKFGWDYEKLYYALDRIGSEAFTKLIMNIADSENTVMQDIMEAVAFRDEMVKNYGFNNWDVNKEIDREFLDNTGKKFKLTLGQMMSLYAYSRREGAWDHIEYGGFVFGEAALTNPKPADSYKLSKENCEAITNLLTKEQKGYVEDMQKFLSKTMGEKGNEVSMLLYGIKMFGEENYFPIHIAGQYKAQANESQAKAAAGFQSMSNAGFTHAQNPNAKAPFVLEGFNEVWADHVNEMSRYHGTVPALEDLRRVMNRSTYSDSVAESQSIKQLMENHYGKEAVDYFDNLYREANSGAITDKLQKKSHKLLSLFRKNSVAYSLSVLIQQPASLVRAYDLIDRKYFGYKGFGAITSGIAKAVSDKWTKAHTNAYNEMLKYAPGVTMAKEIGGFDTHTGGSIRSYLLDTNKSLKQKWKTGTAMEKGKAVLDVVDNNAIANLPNVADKIAWIEIWNACKRETVATHKDLAVNSEEFMKAVGDRFTEVIRATQVYDSMFAKSPMLKSKNLAVQYLVSFMNEPNTVANMAEKAVRDATRGNWKKGARTAAVLVHSIIFTNVLKSIVYAMRDDDEDETYIEKYIEAVTGNMMDDFNALNYIPLVRDVWSIAQGYDVERADMAIVADALDSLDQVIKNAVKDTDNMTDEELIEFDKKVTDANWKLVESVASFFGIPVKNIRREIEGVLDHARIASANAGQATAKSTWDKIQDAVVDSIPFMQNKNTKQDKLYDAIVSGDKAYIGRLKSTYKTEDAYNNAVRKALRENDPRIQAAAQARYDGNTEEYKRIFREIKNEGKFSFDDIMSAINTELSKLTPDKVTSDYTASGYVEAIIMGNMSNATAMKDDIIATKVANGNTQAEAEREFVSNVATGIRDAYTSGLLDEAGAEKMLMEYADKDEEEAASKVSYWSFSAKHPQYDLTESNVKGYIEFAEPANIPLDVFVQYVEGTKGLSDIKDEWGDIEVSKRDQVLEVINSLPITWQQKDALYLAAGYAESKIWDVPW